MNFSFKNRENTHKTVQSRIKIQKVG